MLETWGISDTGLLRRNNEDCWLIDSALGLALVADGMGGASCGEVAAAIVINTVRQFISHPPRPFDHEALLEQAVREANRHVLDRARKDLRCRGMGSTIVAALWRLPQLVIANVGDSRAYLWRAGSLTQLSYDQTVVNELRLKYGLTDAEVRKYPHRNVLTMAVGSASDIIVRKHVEMLLPGDQVLLCSDGLSGPVTDSEIGEILTTEISLQAKAEALIQAARAAGGPDNITTVLLRYASKPLTTENSETLG